MKDYCHVCNSMVEVEVKKIEEKHKVKGEEFKQMDIVVFCKICGEKIFSEKYDDDNIERAYNQYRKKHGLMLPSEIKELREKYRISQKTMAQVLGWGEVTITRYENGMIQDRAHNVILALIKDETNFIKTVRNSMLSDKQKDNIISKLSCNNNIVEDLTYVKENLNDFRFTLLCKIEKNTNNFNMENVFEKLSSGNISINNSQNCEFNNEQKVKVI